MCKLRSPKSVSNVIVTIAILSLTIELAMCNDSELPFPDLPDNPFEFHKSEVEPPDYALDGKPVEAWRTVIDQLSERLREREDDYQARLKRSEAHLFVREFAKAEVDAAEAIETRPDDPAGRILRAESFLLREDIEKAEAEYKAVFRAMLPDSPLRSRAFAGRALLKTLLIDPPGAVEDLAAALKSNRDGHRFYAILSTGIIETEEYGSSLEEENLALLKEPASIPALEKRILALAAVDMWLGYPLAALDRTALVELTRDNAQVLKERAEYWQYFAYNPSDTELQGRSLRRAVADYTALLRLSPDNTELLSERASCLRELGEHQEALSDIERILELRPNDSKVRGERGMFLVYTGREEEGLTMLEELIEEARRITPMDRSLLRGLFCCLSDVHSRLGQHQSAVDDLTSAIEMTGEGADWLELSRAFAYIEVGRVDLARTYFNRLVENEKPRVARAYLLRARFLIEIGEYQKALADLDEASRRDSLDARIPYERARVLHKMGRTGESEAARKKAVRLDPTYRNVKVE